MRSKTYIWLSTDDDDCGNKEAKGTKKCVMKRKLNDYKSCLEENQLEKEINYLEINKITVDSLRENNKEFIQNNRSI